MELFIVHYETFHTIRVGVYGKDSNLDEVVKLRKLHICNAREQLPSNLELTLKSDGIRINWKDLDHIIVNSSSAEFADISC